MLIQILFECPLQQNFNEEREKSGGWRHDMLLLSDSSVDLADRKA